MTQWVITNILETNEKLKNSKEIECKKNSQRKITELKNMIAKRKVTGRAQYQIRNEKGNNQ